MNDKTVTMPRELAEEILKALILDDWRQAAPLSEILSKTIEKPKMSTKEALEAMSEKDWELVLEKGTNLQLLTLTKSYKKIIGRYQHLCGELYQVLGALDAPAYVLDRVSNASESMAVSNTPSLLPFDKHAWNNGQVAGPLKVEISPEDVDRMLSAMLASPGVARQKWEADARELLHTASVKLADWLTNKESPRAEIIAFLAKSAEPSCQKCGGTGDYPIKGHGLSTIMRNCPCGGSGE